MSGATTLAASVLLAGGVSAAVSAVALRLDDDAPPPVATVRLEALVAAHLAEAASGAPADAQGTRAFARALEAALDAVAARHHVVLLPRRAVAAGAPDLTGAVEAALNRALASTPSGEETTEDGP